MDTLQKGTVLNGRFEILDTIGKGSFGITYKAFDKNLGRDIALKECFPADCGQRGADGKIYPVNQELYRKSLEDMVDEARTLATIKHPRIVTIHDVEACEGALYCVMEWVEGETLRERMDKRKERVDEQTAFQWLTETLQVLECIHAKNIVHRDIKPANIILRPSQLRQGEELVLVDFGSALNRNLKVGATIPGAYTPAYAAPEQVATNLGKIGPWTDMYALAATFYELLGGRPIHSLNGEEPSKLNLQSEILEKTLMKNLSPLPKDRCSTAREWIEALSCSCDKVVVEIQKLIQQWADERSGEKGLKIAEVRKICTEVRNYFIKHLGVVPGEVDDRISAVETIISPARLARIMARQQGGAIAGGAVGAGLIGGGAALAGGAGAGLWGAIVAFFVGGPVAVPVAMGAGGLAFLGYAVKAWIGKSQAQRSSEALECLSKGMAESIRQCWPEYGASWKS